MFQVSSLDWAGLIRDDGGKCHFQGLCTVHVRLQRRLPEIRTPPSSRASARRVEGRCTSIRRVGWLENLYVLESQSQILQITRTLRVRDRAYRCCTHCSTGLSKRDSLAVAGMAHRYLQHVPSTLWPRPTTYRGSTRARVPLGQNSPIFLMAPRHECRVA